MLWAWAFSAMSAADYSIAVEQAQATDQCINTGQLVRVPCCCTVAQAAPNGHYEEIKQLISSG